ncbi:carotenoid biosynthesis protein [Planosporangium thailandense]|uniref:Carotenoid biosynthesis protein n=1 Tax=Planosporangium thailandense TaxID=765197 RepID=A0ABX0XWZ2_9ACTN|nr:carotenoid biosynthesis protein [Planosporangium thailandense]NJC69755.1 carotenoid biosynthesis protein [Planosporangium thailandense]
MRHRLVWVAFAALVLAEIGYPLVSGPARAHLTVATVLIGFAVSVAHAAVSRGPRAAAALVAVAGGGGLAVEALGVATGVPFGAYGYGDALGAELLGVPLVIPLAWTWMAWPAWLTAGRLARGVAARVAVAGLGLAAWDLFLDPQMVAEKYWTWASPRPALPGVPDVPRSNYLGWLVVAVALMALLAAVPDTRRPGPDAPMYALYLWTYASGVLAHAVFLDLPASAAWGGLGMGLVAVPLAVALLRDRYPRTAPRQARAERRISA